MTTTVPSTDLVVSVEPLFTQEVRIALAGFLAGYSGLTRDAYALDLRMFTAWYQQHGLQLFQARRADIECFGRDMEARGRARATIARRLCTIAGFYQLRRREGIARALTRRPHPAAHAWTTNHTPSVWTATRSAHCSWPPGSAHPTSTHRSRCSRSMGYESPKRLAPTSTPSASNAGTAP